MRIYDLTAVFSSNLPVYQGDPEINITPHYAIANGQLCNTSRLSFGSHTGTHVDVPKHFIDDGETCDTVDLSLFYGKAKVLDMRPLLQGRMVVEITDIEPFDINEGDIILLNMGNSVYMRDKQFHKDYVSISADAAQYLADKKIKSLGVDYLSVEAFGNTTFPAHKALLGNGIGIIEGLVFDNEVTGVVPQGTYTLSALPLKFEHGNGSPVRAVLFNEDVLALAIFDMDGLMLDTEPISVDGWTRAGQALGYTFTPEIFSRLFGCALSLCKKRLEDYFGPSFDFDEVYAIRTAYVHETIDRDGVAIKPGLEALLDKLDALGVKKCVATSTEHDRAVQLLKQAGIFHRFDGIIGGDHVKKGKPDPEIFLTAAQRFNAAPCHCVVFEDSITGAEAARAGGMRTILVPDMVQPDIKTITGVSVICKDLQEAALLLPL